MNYKVRQLEKANDAADRVLVAIQNNQWKEVLKVAEEWPELLFWTDLDANLPIQLFIQIWEEDRWIGRECVKILLKNPELMKIVSIQNYGHSVFQVQNEEYWAVGPLTGLLAGAGELELLEEALKAGLDPDGWIHGSWYEGTNGKYFFDNNSGCQLLKPFKSSMKNNYPLSGNNEVTPLLIAILREDVEMVKLLIRYGATFVPDGKLCQEYVKECGSWAIRKLLKEAYGEGGMNV